MTSPSFKLNHIESQAISQQSQLLQVQSYPWKNLNVIELKPKNELNIGDTEIEFQLDSALLGSNYPLNLVEMNLEYEVVQTSNMGVYSWNYGKPYVLGNNFVAGSLESRIRLGPQNVTLAPDLSVPSFDIPQMAMPAGAGSALKPSLNGGYYPIMTPYLSSLANSGLDALVGNKSFSTIKIKNGSNQLRDDSRSVAKVDLMSRLLDQEALEEMGVYPDYVKGAYYDKFAGDREMIPMFPTKIGGDVHSQSGRTPSSYSEPVYYRGASPEECLEGVFWKRNTNNKYIIPQQPQFQTPSTGVWLNGFVAGLNIAFKNSDLDYDAQPFFLGEFTPAAIHPYMAGSHLGIPVGNEFIEIWKTVMITAEYSSLPAIVPVENKICTGNPMTGWAGYNLYANSVNENDPKWYMWICPQSLRAGNISLANAIEGPANNTVISTDVGTNGIKPVQQRQKFTVKEDLLGDIFTTRYSKNYRKNIRPLPSSLMNFTFKKASKETLASLYKTSVWQTNKIEVYITKMTLKIFSFNFGLLDIIPSIYQVPFYEEQQFTQNVEVSNLNVTGNVELQTIKYNRIPPLLLVYVTEPIPTDNADPLPTEDSSFHQNLNTLKISNLKIKIDNDQGSSLYNLTERELADRSLENFGASKQNNDAMFKTTNKLPCRGLRTEIRSAQEAVYEGQNASTNQSNALVQGAGRFQSQSYMQNVYLLRVGEDIRIEPALVANLNRPISVNMTMDIGKTNLNPNLGTASVHVVALFPNVYTMSPVDGLISYQPFKIMENEFWEMLKNTNDEIAGVINKTHTMEFTTSNPQLMIGSGWFGSMWSGIKNALPKVRDIASTISSVASNIDHPWAQKAKLFADHVVSGADFAKDAIGGKAKGKKKVVKRK